jgi:hypothetical protein
VCSLPSIISGVSVALMLPESPKFLMSRGFNDDALKVFIKIHRMNNGTLVEYPVSEFTHFMLSTLNLIKFCAKIFSDKKLGSGKSVGCKIR